MKQRLSNIICAVSALLMGFCFFCPQALAAGPHKGWMPLDRNSSRELASGSYYLAEDMDGGLEINGKVELCLNGHSLDACGKSSVIRVEEGASLSLHDCGKEGRLCGGKAVDGGGIYVGREAALELRSGTIEGCQARRGGGIYGEPSSKIRVSGGTVKECSAELGGGGVYISGTALIDGLTVEGNSAKYNGAGIMVLAQGDELSISNTVISDNEAVGHGAGIYAEDCVLNFVSGTISGNSSTDNYACGGGIYVGRNARLSLQPGAKLRDNRASRDGGGICVSSEQGASLYMSGGELIGNSASNGGGIAATGLGELAISGGKIEGNTAQLNGGGIYLSFNAGETQCGKTLSNCQLMENSALSYGGGAYVQAKGLGEVVFDSVKAEGNTALDGGGAYVEGSEGLSLRGKTHIQDNVCTGRGQNLYLHGARTMSVAQLDPASQIGLSLDYSSQNTFTTDAESRAADLKSCFVSDIDQYGVNVNALGQLELALSCQVSFDAKGGTVDPQSRLYTTGDPLGELPIPQKPGYTFTYWDYNGRKVSPDDPVNFDKTISANYDFNRYSLHFDANGGSGSMEDLSCRYTVPFFMPECGFTNPGMVFAGWSRSPEGDVDFAAGQSACSLCPDNGATLTLYALWMKEPATAISLEESLSMAPGESMRLEPRLEPADASGLGIKWESSDGSVVQVDGSGNVTAVEKGKAKISATLPNGESASCKITVERRDLRAEDFVFDSQRSFVNDGQPKAPELLDFPQGTQPMLRYRDQESGEELSSRPTQPGNYQILIDVEKSQNFNAAEGISDPGWSFGIAQGQQQGIEILGVPEQIFHGDSFQLYVEGGQGNGHLEWSIVSGDCGSIDPQSGVVTIHAIGELTVAVEKYLPGYEPVSAQKSFTVSRRQLYLETGPSAVMEKVYDGTDQAQLLDMGSISGFSQQDEGSIPVYASARFSDSNAGIDKDIIVSYSLGEFEEYYIAPPEQRIPGGLIYPITADIAWNSSGSYEFIMAPISVTAYVSNALPGDSVNCIAYEGATATDAGVYEARVSALDNNNYSLQGAEGNSLSWSIVPRQISIAAQSLSKSYGQPDPELGYIIMEEGSLPLSGSLERAPGEEVGSYAITQGSLAISGAANIDPDNYVLNFSGAVFTIEPAQNQIHDLGCPDLPYGAQPQPWGQADFGEIWYGFSQSPEGGFGPWDPNAAPGLWYVLASVEPGANYSSAQALCSFTYLREELGSFVLPQDIVINSQGDINAQLSAKLPSQLQIVNRQGQLSQFWADISWDMQSVSYPAPGSLSIQGYAALPERVLNNSQQELLVTVTVGIDGPAPQQSQQALPPLSAAQPMQPQSKPVQPHKPVTDPFAGPGGF